MRVGPLLGGDVAQVDADRADRDAEGRGQGDLQAKDRLVWDRVQRAEDHERRRAEEEKPLEAVLIGEREGLRALMPEGERRKDQQREPNLHPDEPSRACGLAPQGFARHGCRELVRAKQVREERHEGLEELPPPDNKLPVRRVGAEPLGRVREPQLQAFDRDLFLPDRGPTGVVTLGETHLVHRVAVPAAPEGRSECARALNTRGAAQARRRCGAGEAGAARGDGAGEAGGRCRRGAGAVPTRRGREVGVRRTWQ